LSTGLNPSIKQITVVPEERWTLWTGYL